MSGSRLIVRALTCAPALLLSCAGVLAQGPPELLWQRGGHEGIVYALAYSPRGDLVASASLSEAIGNRSPTQTIKLWRASDGLLVRTLPPNPGTRRVAFSGDGQVLAAVRQSRPREEYSFVDLWDVSTGQLLHTIAAGGRSVSGIAFSPRSSMLAISNSTGVIRLFDRDATELQVLPGRAGSGLAFSPDESLLAATSGEPGKIALWERNPDGTYSEGKPFFGPTAVSSPLVFSPKGDLLASSEQRTITIWSVSDGTYRTLQDSDTVTSLSFSVTGLLASSGSSRMGKLWSVESGELFQELGGNSNWLPAIAFSPDGERLFHLVYARELKMWARTAAGRYAFLGNAHAHTDTPFSAAFSPDGAIFASGAAIYNPLQSQGEVKLWNASNGQMLQTLTGHALGVYGVGFSVDSRTFASASWDRTVKVWVRQSVGEPFGLLQTLTDHTDQVNAAIFSGNDLLASASKDSTIRIWRRQVGGSFGLFQTLDRSVGGHEGEVEPLAFSPDGYLLISGGHDARVKVWGLRVDGRYGLLQTLEHPEEVESVALSRDKRMIVAGGEDGNVRVWQRGPGGIYVVRDTFEAHSGVVHSIAFSADDLFFVSVGDRTIKFWVAADSTKALTYDQETGTGLRAVAFSPDGSLFGYARDDATVSVASYPFLGTVFVAYMDGAQETPPVETPASGFAVLALNANQTQVKLVMKAYDFKGPVLFSHVHRERCGVFGFVEFGITGSDFQNPVVRTWNIPPHLLPALFNGGLYVNVHTQPHSGGEIRGQVLPIGQHCPPH